MCRRCEIYEAALGKPPGEPLSAAEINEALEDLLFVTAATCTPMRDDQFEAYVESLRLLWKELKEKKASEAEDRPTGLH
jgi:hypothetical protein